MNFSFTEEQVMIRESAQTFLADSCSSESVRAAMQLSESYDPALWTRMGQELGWSALPVPEDQGGLGLGPVELMLVQEQMGYRLVPAPFFSSVCLASTLLLQGGDEQVQGEWLESLASGEQRLSADLPSHVDAWQAGTGVIARAEDDLWRLDGILQRVPEAVGADGVVLVADCAGEPGLFVVAAQDCQIEVLDSWDASRRFSRVTLEGVTARRCDREDLPAGLRQAASLMRLYIAAEQLGSAQRCLDLTVDYVQERKQFGRAVGSFQAVKHRCAQMMVASESTRSAVYGAAALAASAPDARMLDMETAAARALASESLKYCAGEAIQLHGGVGFTWEYDPQLFFKRAAASAHWLGTPDELHAGLAACLLD